MSFRYVSGFNKPGLNTLVQGTPTYTYYLYSWGANQHGQLGLGNLTYRSSPNQIGALTDWSVIPGGYYSSTSIKTDGTLWSWGRNNFGQLGLGNTTNYSSPKQVGALTAWLTVSAGYSHCAAVKTDGTLWTWGRNQAGALGLGNTTSYSSPKQVGALTNWLKVAASGYTGYTLAIKTDGTLWSWGGNNYGQQGNGSISPSQSPAQVGALTDWSTVVSFASSDFVIATKTNGTMWSWGTNNHGQLGLNNRTYYSSPKQIGALTTWLNVACGVKHSVITKTDGTLWTWGQNLDGNLGLGNLTNYSSPKQVGSLTTWLKTAAGYNFCMASKTDGTLWSWGLNSSGELGLGNTTKYSSPKQVGALTNWGTISCSYHSSFALAY